ncbi:hypothetical protein KKC08_01475 [Patescibacteria group bacterium]|nr:hypothetical protein [Patescibacteria group bacterium]MCG2701513.1 hypothetical protein [Candidatus Parcubacteria bacterium]MBU4209816.1 hypothetical protein [Patescibacteria group bacterium]MBU4265284.1 hypothetical protein [Patescibacteria group bacterium]MBU4389969.1 hypothetical protein [Patescibacteria group bacterium]
MNKKTRFFLSSFFLSVLFFVVLSLPYNWHYFGVALLSILTIFVYWLSLKVWSYKSWRLRWMMVLLPAGFVIGLSLFLGLLSLSLFSRVFLVLFFGFILNTIFLVENIFLVAIGYKTVPLYRTAYTVSLVLVLLTAFFLFDSILSFRMSYYLNAFFVSLVSCILYAYQFWVITIELPDDGKNKSLAYVWIPALLMGELALIFSFWPVGIFKGSIYLVSFIYIVFGLLQAEIRGRLFKKTWMGLAWVFVALVLGMLVVTKWG